MFHILLCPTNMRTMSPVVIPRIVGKVDLVEVLAPLGYVQHAAIESWIVRLTGLWGEIANPPCRGPVVPWPCGCVEVATVAITIYHPIKGAMSGMIPLV